MDARKAVGAATVVAALMTGGLTPSRAQSPSGPPTACAGEQYHQFDFWIGEWEVRNPQGQLQGTNRIEPIQGGCVLQEHWTSASGGTGTSFNIYDFTRDKWHQTWVSGTNLLVLEGGFRDGKMIMEGVTVGRDGEETLNRITWTPLDDGAVTQVWETSGDGNSWRVVFNGRYTRVK